ncbi:MAG: hypothetical protein R2831_07800 [Chitinophagaceae bacterium]
MLYLFSKNDIKTFSKKITAEDIASFDSGIVHPVYSTFALARDAEWSGRLFVLEMKEEHEEGIGTFLHIHHKSPALVGTEIQIVSSFEEVTAKGEVITSFKVFANQRLLAEGQQGQRILPKEKIKQLFSSL